MVSRDAHQFEPLEFAAFIPELTMTHLITLGLNSTPEFPGFANPSEFFETMSVALEIAHSAFVVETHEFPLDGFPASVERTNFVAATLVGGDLSVV